MIEKIKTDPTCVAGGGEKSIHVSLESQSCPRTRRVTGGADSEWHFNLDWYRLLFPAVRGL